MFTFEAGVQSTAEPETELAGITGGSGHNFERLPEESEPYYEERAFGFRVNTPLA